MWNGICVLMEANEESGEINADIKKKKAVNYNYTQKLVGASMLIIIALGFFSIKENILLFSVSFLGLVLSVYLLLREKSFFSNSVIDICKFGKNFDCDKVISSDESKILGYSLSAISTGFFLFIMVSLFTSNITGLSCAYVVPIIYLSSVSVFYTIFQQIKMKAYCIICLTISFTLCSLIAIVYFNSGFRSFHFNTYNLLFSLAITIMILGLIRNYLFMEEESKRLTNRVKSFLDSPLITNGFVDCKIENCNFEKEITIGESKAKFEIILFINPHCKKCKLIIKNLSRFFSAFEDQVYMRILYSGLTEDASESKILYANLYEYLSKLDNNGKIDYFKEDYNLKHVLKGNASAELLHSLTKQSLWSNELGLEGTPAIILNNVILPSFFGVEEVSFLLYKINSFL